MATAETKSIPAAVPPPQELREKLNRLVVAELLGPQGGPTEEVAESRVSDRYLVGMLAPRSQTAGQEADEGFEDGSEPEESDDGKADPVRTRSDSLLPSSFGMTFVVAKDAKEIEVEARWGKYERVESETITHKPKKKGGAGTDGEHEEVASLVWKREPKGGQKTIPLGKPPLRREVLGLVNDNRVELACIAKQINGVAQEIRRLLLEPQLLTIRIRSGVPHKSLSIAKPAFALLSSLGHHFPTKHMKALRLNAMREPRRQPQPLREHPIEAQEQPRSPQSRSASESSDSRGSSQSKDPSL